MLSSTTRESPATTIEKFIEQSKYFRDPNEPDRVLSKGKKIEVVYAVVSKGIPLFRTEGVGDVSLIEIHTDKEIISVPVILPEKMQAKLRRQMLEKLRASFNQGTKSYIIKYAGLNYKRAGEDGSWNCYVAPPKEAEETDIGMCGFCPACNILGAIITRDINGEASTSYGLKSRVVHDPAYGTVKYEKAVIDLTHNKVGDGVSYTGKSLFEESHILPGIVFLGKLAMYDLTKREAKLVLSSLVSIARMGGAETKYGSVQVIILGLKDSERETISSYDIARHILEKLRGDTAPPEQVLREAVEYIKGKGFTIVVDPSKKIDELTTAPEIKDDEINKIWSEDNYKYSENVVNYIREAEGKTKGKKVEKESKKEVSARGRE